MKTRPTNPYATDGLCHNANSGTYGHECGKPAVWLGIRPASEGYAGFASGFCDRCRNHGTEAKDYPMWEPYNLLPEFSRAP